MAEIETHRREIEENRGYWGRKPLLRRVYRDFYETIASWVDRRLEGEILELGSGMGNIKETLPRCVTSDLFPNPWLDRREDAYALSPGDGQVANLILFDVWHHLQYPACALAEFHRVLAQGGRVLIFDPAMGLLGKLIYGICHHEPLALADPIVWSCPKDFDPQAQGYYAAQGNCWRAFRGEHPPGAFDGWRVLTVRYFPAFAYLASGGFRGPRLLPAVAFQLLRPFEAMARLLPALFATRMLVVLQKV